LDATDMDRSLSLSLIIGATVAGTLGAAIGQTVTQVGRVGEAVKRVEGEQREAIARTAVAQQRMGQIDAYRKAGQDALASARDHRQAADQVGALAREWEATRAEVLTQSSALQQTRSDLVAAGDAAKSAAGAEQALTNAVGRTADQLRAGEAALAQASAARATAETQAAALAEQEKALADAMAAGNPATAQQVAALDRAQAATARATAALEKRQAAEQRVRDAVASGAMSQDRANAALQNATEATRQAAETLDRKRAAEQKAADAVAAGAPATREQRRDLDQARAALARATEAVERKRQAEQRAAEQLASARQRLTEQSAALDRAGAEAREAAASLAALRAREAELAASVAAGNTQTREQAAALDRARAATQRAAAEAERQRQRVIELRGALQAAGVDTANLGRAQRELATDMAKASQAADQAQAELEQLGDASERVAKRMEIGATMQRGALQIGAIAASMSLVIGPAVEFESVMADVKKVVNFDSPEQFRAMADDVLALSRRIPMASSGLGEIMAAAGQSGIARAELLRFTEDAAKMGVAFDLSGKEAGGAMTGLRTIFKLSQDDVIGLGDAINHLSNNMDARAADILTLENRAGSMGRMFGLTAEQVGALGATFLALKTPPEVAATGINALLGKLATATTQPKEFQEALRDIGLEASDLKDAIQRDAQGALLDFLKAVDGSEDKMTTLAKLFGQEYADDMAKLVSGLGTYQKALGLVGDQSKYAGSMQREFQERASTTGNGITLMNNSVGAAATKIGDALLPILDAGAHMLATVADGVAYLAGEFPWLIQGIATVGGFWVAYASVTTIASWANTFFAGGLPAVIGRLMGLTAATAASTTATAAGGAASAVATAGLWAQARAAVAASLGWLRVGASVVIAQAPLIGGALISGITAVGGALMSVASVAIPMVIGGLRALAIAVMANPIGLIIGGIALAAGLLISNWDAVGPFFSGLWEGVSAGAEWLWGGLQSLAGWTPIALVIQAWSPVATWFNGLWDGITGKVGAAVDWIAGKLSWAGDAMAWLKGDERPVAANASPANDNAASAVASPVTVPAAPAIPRVGQIVEERAVVTGGAPRPVPATVPDTQAIPRIGRTAEDQAADTGGVPRPVPATVPDTQAIPRIGRTAEDQAARSATVKPPSDQPGKGEYGQAFDPESEPPRVGQVVPLVIKPRAVPVGSAASPAPARPTGAHQSPPQATPQSAQPVAAAANPPPATRIEHREEIHIHVHGVSDPRQVADMVMVEMERRRRRSMNE
jgi:TP901 family phage tail tape measure protein